MKSSRVLAGFLLLGGAAFSAPAERVSFQGSDIDKRMTYRLELRTPKPPALYKVSGDDLELLTDSFDCRHDKESHHCEPRERVRLPGYGYPDFELYEVRYDSKEASLVGLSGHSGPQVFARLRKRNVAKNQ
jgi:hypothetical protein